MDFITGLPKSKGFEAILVVGPHLYEQFLARDVQAARY
jgi:hypothetical protein